MQVTIYHNAKCSKSREALEYLHSQPLEVQIVEYLESPPCEQDLRRLTKMLGVAPSSLVRARDFDRLGLQPPEHPDEWIGLIGEYPILLERPIVVCGDQACIGRPLQQLVDWLEDLRSTESQP
ncbi:ArsC/Spx/MgsR family protein [Aeoliella straminimaris]|uniref:ArsC/Spx/MgsR family protein n=1 Tax=Aeoliella straminimaris TaxID=2954799 RepID=UPI003CC65B8D